MATISLTLPQSGTVITAGLHSSNYGTLQSTINGGLDNNNFATGKIFDTTKLMQNGALDQQVLKWTTSGSQWAPAFPPGYELAYQAYSTDQTTTSTSFADLFTFAAATFENVRCYLEVSVPSLTATIANDTIEFRLMEGVSQVGDLVSFDTHSNAGSSVCAFARIPFTPTAASHTYKVQWLTAFAATAKIKASVGDATFRIVKA